MRQDPDTLTYIYDGDCPLCSEAARTLTLKNRVTHLDLVDARTDKTHPCLIEALTLGLDLDQGSVVHYGGEIYHGAEAMHLIAGLSDPWSLTGLFYKMVFSTHSTARISYPMVRGLRNILLKLSGKSKLALRSGQS